MKNGLFIVLLGISFFACKKEEDPIVRIPVDDVQKVADMNNGLGWDLFLQMAKSSSDSNLLISPLSIHTAMSMALNAAESNTFEEMSEVMHCKGCDETDINEQNAKLRTLMEEQSGRASLTSANAFFFDEQRIAPKQDFLNTINAHYKAESLHYDFNLDSAKDNINAWVKAKTNGKIDKIVENIGPLDLAFLINALHFKAGWLHGFEEDMTWDGDFTRYDGSTVVVPFVSGDRLTSFVQTDEFNMVDFQFTDSTYSMSFVQSKSPQTLSNDWIQQLSWEEIKTAWGQMKFERAFTSFPKLNLAYTAELKHPLTALGMIQAFLPETAQFGRLGTALIGPGIYVTTIKHKAVLKVDENGAEGAAVTSIGFGTTSAPPSFRFDKPFVIILRHIPTNAMVFTGLVKDPSKIQD
jgi:serine protease inhibitor